MELIQKGNTKLAEAGILMFNLPAGSKVCGRACAGCYAIKEQRYPTVVEAREKRWEASKQDDFTEKVVAELRAKKTLPKYFRVHSSGDFYSQEYVSKWAEIAKTFPSVIFYAYTKRVKKFDFTALTSLDNFVLINSMQYGDVNYGKVEDAPKDVFVCPDVRGSEVTCGVNCTYCMSKHAQNAAPFFIKH